MHRATILAALLTTLAVPAAADEAVEFNRDVRPILSDRCFACHGPDASAREAELRLDLRESAVERPDGAVIVPGEPNNSELMRRVRSDDPFEVMPPEDHGSPLSSGEIEILHRWIAQGAKYQRHWSLESPTRPPIPSTPTSATNPIDAFIQARWRQQGLTSSGRADPRVLARRLSFDLVGLPPAPAMVERFVADPSEDAYRELVEQLLQSPHFGERMAIYWLDLVRYADTLGYHGDQPRSVSPYRDYVIRAFNDNKPFDDFTVEQLAGDLLPNATLSQKVASTYNRLNRASGEGGVQPKEYLAKYSADRVRTTGAVWLGSTFGCAECHDHKFDPLTARDFYNFAAFFADIKEQGIVKSAVHLERLPVPTPAQSRRQRELADAIRAAEAKLQRQTPERSAAQRQWERELEASAQRWTVLRPAQAQSAGGATLKTLEDHSVLASGKNPDRDVYTLEFSDLKLQPDRSGRVALRLELLPDKSLPQDGPGRAGNGNFVLHEAKFMVDGEPVKWTGAFASHTQTNHAAEHVITGHKHGWAILPETGKPQQLVLVGELPGKPESDDTRPTSDSGDPAGTLTGGSTGTLTLRQHHGKGHNIGRFRVSVTQDPPAGESKAAAPIAVEEQVLAAAARAPDERSDDQQEALDAAFRKSTPLLAEVRETLRRLRVEQRQLQDAIVTTLATTSAEPRVIRVLPRGNWMDDSGAVAEPRTPAYLPQLSADSDRRQTRLDLARWIVSPDNPLTARTFVNRLWMLMFGEGLARSVDDLGSQGAPPTHPQLLDWLSVEFIESGWDVKHMVRLLVNSDTYRQSSQAPSTALELDPGNRWLARQSRRRLDAEMVRDNALAVSGLLNGRVGGVSAKPYQPAGYWAQLNFPKRTYQHDQGPRQYRRGLYTHWQRTFLHPSLLAFDAPAREECTARRARSNTPLQALVLLNDPTFVEAARVLATQAMEQPGEFPTQLRWVFRKTLMREPRPDEAAVLSDLYAQELAAAAKRADEAAQVGAVGLAPAPENVDAAELAAWTSVTRTLLNLHETITRY